MNTHLSLGSLCPAPAGGAEDGQRSRAKKRRRLYRSESESFSSPAPLQLQPRSHADAARRPPEARPFPVGIRTIGSFHGAMTNSRLDHHVLQATLTKQEAPAPRQVQTVVHGNIASFRQQKAAHGSPAASSQRGRRRALCSPVFSPLVVGGENYSLASPSVRICAEERGRVQLSRFHHPTR